MIFTDLRFLLVFAGCWLSFFAVPRPQRSAALAVWGVVFYALYAGAFLGIALLLVWAVMNARQRWRAWAAGATIVALLIAFKLAEAQAGFGNPGFPGQILIPLGLSYLSFELLHVIIEQRRGKLAAIRAVDLLAYAFFLPCRVAGPIRRFNEFSAATQNAEASFDNVYHGVLRILLGLAKKLIVADTLALTGAEIGYVQTGAHAWTVVVAYGIRIFVDFSAYSDVAIGFARLMGITVPENFASPYLATNIRDFWSRWHITLSQWVRDYIFVPTGRRLFATALRPYPSVIAVVSYLVTFLVVGGWHGLTPAFLVWGLYHGALLGAHHVIRARLPLAIGGSRWYRSRAASVAACGVTFVFVTVGWLPFMTDLETARKLLVLMLPGGR